MRSSVAIWIACGAVIWVGSRVASFAQTTSATAPLLITSEVQVEIAEINYVPVVDGVNETRARVQDQDLDKYRCAVVSLKVTKPPGYTLEIAAADLSLHYRHSSGVEVAPCEGISAFNQNLAEDRGITLSKQSGPMWVKQRTGVRASQAQVVYLDAIFKLIEPSISQAWIAVAKPVSSQPFVTKGWNPAAPQSGNN